MSSNNKITRIGKVKIVNDLEVYKKKEKDINYLYQHLSGKDFYSYPELIDEDESFYIFKYIKEKRKPRINDALSTLALLHSKTSEEKVVNRESFKNIYDKLKENITHIKYYYESFISSIESKEYFSPSEYLFIRNVSKLLFMIKYCEDETEKWYKKVKDNTSTRVCMLHNNLRLSHVLIEDEPMFISFDNYKIDSPVIDLYKFYKNEDYNIEILDKFNVYNDIFAFNEEEMSLFKILVTLPCKIKLNESELNNTNKIKLFVERIYKTEEFIKKNSIKEEENTSEK